MKYTFIDLNSSLVTMCIRFRSRIGTTPTPTWTLLLLDVSVTVLYCKKSLLTKGLDIREEIEWGGQIWPQSCSRVKVKPWRFQKYMMVLFTTWLVYPVIPDHRPPSFIFFFFYSCIVQYSCTCTTWFHTYFQDSKIYSMIIKVKVRVSILTLSYKLTLACS